MRFAVIGDIHGNKYALESVLKDIDSKNVDFVISTGDLVGYMPYPNEVIEMVRKNNIMVVQGNHDKAIAQSEKITTEEITRMTEQEIQSNASTMFTRWCITDRNKRFLKELNTRLTMECDGLKIVIVHGSPVRVDEYLYEDTEILMKTSKQTSEDIVICGHTHIPYFAEVNKKYFINAGSVGKPKHGDCRSTYVIVEVSEGRVSCSIQRVSYNLEDMIKDIKDNEMISNELIVMLQEGK